MKNIFKKETKEVRKNESGMTLIEIMIVIVIIGMLGTGVTIAFMSQLEESQKDTAKNEACTIRSAVTMYQLRNPGECPTLDDLKNGYLDSKKRTVDPWGNPYQIECDGTDVDVYSTGVEGDTRIACEEGGDN